MGRSDQNGASGKDKRVHDPVDFVPTTDWGREMMAMRAEMIAAGLPLLTDEEAEIELASRRGSLVVVRDDTHVR
jgi:hypothetical protein